MDSKWTATLSDGSIFCEQWIEGELSPWQRLLAYLAKTGLRIVQLQLQVAGKVFLSIPNAQGYYQAKRASATCGEDGVHEAHGIGYVVGDALHTMWVDLDTGMVWHEVTPAHGPGIWRDE